MTTVDIIFQFALYTLPSVAFFGAVWYFTSSWVEVQTQKHKLEAIHQPEQEKKLSEVRKHFFPLQVDAYQRMVLFLERIAPNNIVMRLNNPALPAKAFQASLLETIRNEYEHNLAQQVFVSADAWQMVQNSKEEVLKIINMAATHLEPTSLANDLSKSIFEITATMEVQPTDRAIAFLKAELNKQLG
jgi:lipopolysaccharide export LptBFGC system permease protein LptF